MHRSEDVSSERHDDAQLRFASADSIPPRPRSLISTSLPARQMTFLWVYSSIPAEFDITAIRNRPIHQLETDPLISCVMPISFPQSNSGPSSTPSNESYPSFPSSISGSESMSDVSSEYSDDDDDERERALIREEWEDSLRQMQMLFSIVLVPFFGKWMGRRWSYWGEFVYGRHITNTGAEYYYSCAAYERYHQVGLGRKFLGLA